MFLVFPSCLGWWLITANEETVEHLLVSTSLLFPGQSPTCSFSTLSIEVWRCQSACDCLEPATGFRRTVAQEVLNRFHWRSEDSHHPNGSFCWDHSWAKHLWLQPMGWWRTDIPHGKAPKSGCCLTTEGPDKTGPVWLCMCDDTTVSVVDFSQRQHPPCRENIKNQTHVWIGPPFLQVVPLFHQVRKVQLEEEVRQLRSSLQAPHGWCPKLGDILQ